MRIVSLALVAGTILATSSLGFAAEPLFTWNGFYVGAHAGYAWAKADINTTLGPPASCGGGVINCNAIAATESQALRPHGFSGGLLAGYNIQNGPWVYGVEADISGLPSSKSRTVTDVFPVGGCCFTVTQKVRTDWLMTARPRVGYAFDRTLLYLTGGLALAQLKYNEQTSDTADNSESTNRSSVKVGWTLGAGVEYALADRWLLRGDYSYTNIGTVAADTSATIVSYVVATPLIYSHRVDFSFSVARAALIYRLGR